MEKAAGRLGWGMEKEEVVEKEQGEENTAVIYLFVNMQTEAKPFL